MFTHFKDLTNQRFGRLIALSLAPKPKPGPMRWNCRCDCGNEKVIVSPSLVNGNTTSCGCAQRDAVSKHGCEKNPLYDTWRSMKYRCENPKSKDFPNYSRRGISVCERWQDVRNFIADVPPKPSPELSFDRIDNERGYEPGNVRWATSKQQARNTSRNVVVEIDGRKMNLSEWAKFLNVAHNTISEYAKRNKLSVDIVIRQRLSK